MRAVRVCAGVALIWLAACGDSRVEPAIDYLLPARAEPGAVVEILGAGFCGGETNDEGKCLVPPVGFVSFGDRPVLRAETLHWQDDRISAVVPLELARGNLLVVVTIGGVATNSAAIELY